MYDHDVNKLNWIFNVSSILPLIKADLLLRYGGVAPKMAEEAHELAIDQVGIW